MTGKEVIDDLEGMLKYAPRDPGPIAADLLGWQAVDGGLFVCSHCSGRLFARGCRLPGDGWQPLWASAETDDNPPTCCLDSHDV